MALIGRQLVDQYPVNSTGTLTYGLTWLPTDYATTTNKYPLIIFLHGGGETGSTQASLSNLITTALPQKIAQGFNVEASGKKFIVVSPQAPSGSYFHTQVQWILADVVNRYRVDTNQVYITGLSYGGGGTWRCVTNGNPLAEKFAAILPISAIEVETAQETAEIPNITKVHNVKVWAICGAEDGLVSVTERYVASVNSTSPSPLAKITEIAGAGHTSATWNTLYDPNWRVNGLSVYEWMLQYSRTGVITPPPTTTTTTTSTSTTIKPTTTTTTTSTSTSTSTSTTTTTTTKAIGNPGTGTTRKYITPGVEGGKTVDGTTFSYAPGDTFVLKSSDVWTYLLIKDVHGTAAAPITIINEGGQVQMSSGIAFMNCTYIKMVFNGSQDQYGLRVNSPGRAAWAVNVQGKSAHMEFAQIHIEPAFYGFLIKNEADCDTTVNDWIMDDFYIHDNLIKNMDSQGMYLGSTDPSNLARPIVCNGVQVWYAPSRLGNFKITNNIIQDTGRPGIQLSCASTGMSEIASNSITNTGLQLNDAQGVGIELGGFSRAYIHDNNIDLSYTWGIACFGSGFTRIENNVINTTGKNSIGTLGWGAGIVFDTRTTTPIDLTTFSIKNNTLSNIGQVPHIEIGQLFKTYGTGNLICSNTTDGAPSVVLVDPGIDWSNCGAPPVPTTTTTTTTTKAPVFTTSTTTTTTAKPVATIILDITINGAHYTLYSDNTWR